MNNRRSIFILLGVVAGLLAIVATACATESEAPAGGEIPVVTTTYPLTYITKKIGGDRVSVDQMVKPGVEAHDFEPAPSDIRAIADSALFIYNHPSFEPWALNAAAASSNDGEQVTVVVQTINLESAGEDHGGQAVDDSSLDSHVWLNPLKAHEQAERILFALIEVDPEGTNNYTRNADALKVELRALDELISKELTNCELDSVVVSHLAFGHLAERYGFNQIGLAGLSPEFESGPAQIAKVIERIDELGIEHILQEPIVSDRLAITVAAETGAKLLPLHPLEVRTSEEAASGLDYIDIMKANAVSLGSALRCS
jgi:zinc transport system substrate-binding protein